MQELESLLSLYDTNGISTDIKDKIPRVIGGIKLNSLFKTGEFGGVGGIVGTNSKSNKPLKANIGPTIEVLKSIALFTKLSVRSKITITDEDILQTINKIKNSAVDTGKIITVEYTEEVPDVSGTVTDKITIEIAVARASFQRAIAISESDTDAWGRLKGIINYVNTESDLKKYNRFFFNNNKRDPIDISVNGISGKKADINTTYVDPSGKRRPLHHLSMSIKAGSDKYEQASGLNEAGNIKFFEILGLSKEDAKSAFSDANFNNDLPLAERIQSVVTLYSIAAQKLEKKIISLDDNGEAKYIDTFLKNLTKAIQGDERLVYVNFDINGTYYKLNPQLIATLADHVDLEVNLDISKKWPYLYITDSNSGENIMHVRLQVNSTGRLTHVFELDNLLYLVKESTSSQTPIDANITPAEKPTPAAAPVPPGIQNQTRNLGSKIPMGSEPAPDNNI
jgi:hypothetical protein